MSFYDFFQAPEHHFWIWEDNTDVIAVNGGMTIAYREHVMHILSQLSPGGVPPFGALLMCIAATNPMGSVLIQQVQDKLKACPENIYPELLDDCIAFMHTLSRLPQQYKSGEDKLLMLRSIFHKCHNQYSYKQLQAHLYSYQKGNYNAAKLMKKQAFNLSLILKDCRTMSLLNRHYSSPEDILQAMAAVPGADFRLPAEPADTPAHSSDFVEELENNYRSFHIGRLIRRIWSGLTIPFHNTLPSAQPVGGVSDLSNKGDYDRLLISEYANDDLLFLSRLANNEALYLQREVPPEQNERERIILIDVSLKNWGTPKVLAHALMLAIARHPKTDIRCRAFVIGSGYREIFFGSVKGVIEGIQHAQPILNPAAGLQKFLDEYPGQNSEIVLISVAGVLKQPAMQKVMQDNQQRIQYRLLTDNEGHISVYKRMQNSLRFIQTIQLPLEELWKPRSRPTVSATVPLPASENEEFPLLFPPQNNIRRLIPLNNTLYLISNERSLLSCPGMSPAPLQGWQMQVNKLPYSTTACEMGMGSNGILYLLLFHARKRELCILNVNSGKYTMIPFPDWKYSGNYPHFFFSNDRFFYLLNQQHYWTIDPEQGTLLKNEQRSWNELSEAYHLREKEYAQISASPTLGFSPVLKNISRIFITPHKTLVIHNHELSLLPKDMRFVPVTELTPLVYAEDLNKNTFHFADGSSIHINRNGMLKLRSSKSTLPDIWIPSVLDLDLAAAAGPHFTGPVHFLPDKAASTRQILSIHEFYASYIQPFITQITAHGT